MLTIPKRAWHLIVEDQEVTLDDIDQIVAQGHIRHLAFVNCGIEDEHVRRLCRLSGMTAMFLECSEVTDAVMPDIGGLKKLQTLDLSGTRVSDAGLACLANHPSLQDLYLGDTGVTGGGLVHLLGIPTLAHLGLKHVVATEAQVLALAVLPNVKVNVEGKFGKRFEAQFEQLQREQARVREGREAVRLDDGEMQAARKVLEGFLAEMAQWEADCFTLSKSMARDDFKKNRLAKAREVFARYCTVKKRAYGPTEAVSYGSPSQYEARIVDAEALRTNKVRIYARMPDSLGQQYRYILLRRREGWRIDYVEWLMDEWEQTLL